MAEKFDFKNFYRETFPSSQNILRISNLGDNPNTFKNKNNFIAASNQVFGLLAHLNLTTYTKEDSKKLSKFFNETDNENLYLLLGRFKILLINEETGMDVFNPTAIPMVQRYRKLFDEYEKQNGLISFYKQFDGKEPGDN